MMTIEEALNYINSRSWSQWRLGLSRTRELLRRVGDPQKDLKFVHIAGTNGKGSTSAMIASMLIASGYRTGMYPSPFIEKFNERIQINGVQISDDDLCELTERVKAEGDDMEDHPTHFEIITAIGMLYFKRMGCDIVVLEVGLGGTFDSTNVIDAAELSVITNIGIDHTQYLGDTLAEIASAKAGIIKEGTDVVCYPNVPEVMDVVEAACREKGVRLTVADFGRMNVLDTGLGGQKLKWGDIMIDLPLSGEYQVRNAAVALTAAEELAKHSWDITPASMAEGMSKVKWPARFELLGTDPVFILDGGHNLQCAEAVAESLERYLPEGGLTLLIGMLADKNYEEAVDVLLPFASKCVCVTPDSDRALPAAELAEVIKEHAAAAMRAGTRDSSIDVTVCDSMPEAVRGCINGESPVLAFGSLYLAGEIRSAYRQITGKDM